MGLSSLIRMAPFLWSNPAFSQMTGYTEDEIIGQNPRILKSGKYDAEFYHSLWDTILAGYVWHGELINRRKDGSLYYEDQIITPVFDQRWEYHQFYFDPAGYYRT